MTHESKTDDALEPFFAAARATPPLADEALLRRIEADARAMQPRAAAVPEARSAKRPGRGLRDRVLAPLLRALGGWPALGGLAAATVAGVWIGVAAPAALADTAQALIYGADSYQIDLDPDTVYALAEGGL